MAVAFALSLPLRRLLAATGFYRLVWHRPLFDLALFVVLLGGVVTLAHRTPPMTALFSVLVPPAGHPRDGRRGAVVGLALWDYYMEAPWTRDGRVRADVVAVAPDVSGLVTEVLVADNHSSSGATSCSASTPTASGSALRQAEAMVEGRRATAEQAAADYARYAKLSDAAVSQQKVEAARAADLYAQAAYARPWPTVTSPSSTSNASAVRAAVSGRIANMELRPGAYVTTGRGRDGADRQRYGAGRGLFRGDQAAAHPRRRRP